MRALFAATALLVFAAGCSDDPVDPSNSSGYLSGSRAFTPGWVGHAVYGAATNPDNRIANVFITDIPASCIEWDRGYLVDGGSSHPATSQQAQVWFFDPGGLRPGATYNNITQDARNAELSDGGGESTAHFFVKRSDLLSDGGEDAQYFSTAGTASVSTFTATRVSGTFDVQIALPDGGDPGHLSGSFDSVCGF